MPTYFYCAACPCATYCSASAWKRAAVWGATLDTAIQRCKSHLVTSSLHSLSEDEARELAAAAEYCEEEYDEEGSQPQPRGHKRPRSPPTTGARPSSRPSQGDGSITVPRGQLQAIVESLQRAAAAAKASQRCAP